MAERVPASITIGGMIDAETFAELAEIIAGESLLVEWDGDPFEPHHRAIGEQLRLYAHEVAWGRFEFLESYCITQGLPFIRWSGGNSSLWGPERVVFRGTDEPERYAADEEDDIVLCRSLVRPLGSYAAILAYFDAAEFEPPALVVAGDPDPLPPRSAPDGAAQGG